MNRITRSGSLALLGAAAVWVAACSNPPLAPPAGSGSSRWVEYPGNPIIQMGDRIETMLWNDPTVVHAGDDYRMWLSGGDPRGRPIRVAIYHARSSDGIDWEIEPKPVLEPGEPGSWDSLRVETPSVVRAGSSWHMYYSGADEASADEGIFAIGHATSSDGIHWKRDPANPILRGERENRHRWGFRGVGEPSVIYLPDQNLFRMYYVSMRFSETGERGLIGILVAESKDGSRFDPVREPSGERKLALTRDIPTATAKSWFGYSTPGAVLDPEGRTHLFVAFIVAPKGPATARHVTIDHAVSRDGINFEVVELNIFEAGKGDWKSDQARSPTAIWDSGGIRLWFAGESRTPHFMAGIGTAKHRSR